MDYEQAITLCGGYGPYQTKLFLMLIPVAFTFVFGVSSISYIMPTAICEFDISKYKHGLMYSAIYLGMVPSGAAWGALSDIIGRRKTLILTCGIAGVFEFLGGLSFNYWILFACKFFAGCSVAGVHLTYYVYMSEFTDPKNKDSITMLSGAVAAAGYFIQPLMAYFLIPMTFKWTVIERFIYFNSWKVFLIISSIPPLLGFFISLFCISESPKFLLLTNRKEESLKVLQDIFVRNTGKNSEEFPVKDIVLQETHETKPENKKSTEEGQQGSGFTKSIRQIRPLFRYPYLIPALMSFAAQMITMGSFNAIRPYIPTLFSLALGFGQVGSSSVDAEKMPFCKLFESQRIFTADIKCDNDNRTVDPRIFLGSIIVGICVFISFFPFKKVVNVFGKIRIFLFSHLLSALCICLFPFSMSVYGLIIICVYSVCMQNSLTIVIGLMIARTPTTMRGVAVSLVMVFGRIGVILGNQMLPIVTNLSCHAGFIAIAIVNLLSVPIMFVLSRQPNPLEELARKASEPANETSTLPPKS